ncbi:hypothetical protein BJ165DRAFT_1062173 [Panaeolus papilionaceus]|nr:hypothetical protein BJ165DRAFT_1062173 [Panaeolus papilionaceus]
MPTVDLPRELYELIVEHIWDSKITLTACAISHRCFTALCRRHLFNQISLHIPNSRTGLGEDKKEKRRYWEKRCRTLGEIFLHNPRIMYDVRRFKVVLDCGKLFGDFPDMVTARAVADLLVTLGELENPKLEQITLICPLTAPYWSDIPSTIQCAVFGLRRCASIAELRLENVQLSPLPLIETWTGLKALVLDRSSFLEGLFQGDRNGDSQGTRFGARKTSQLEEAIPVGPKLLQLQVRNANTPFNRLYGCGHLRMALRGLQHLSLGVLTGAHKHLVPGLVDGVSSTLTCLELYAFYSTLAAFID